MKNLILAIFASLALFCATFTVNTNTLANTNSQVNVMTPEDEYTYVRVYDGGVWYIYVYGPGGKLVNVFVESLE
jgi:hypothetical protein